MASWRWKFRHGSTAADQRCSGDSRAVTEWLRVARVYLEYTGDSIELPFGETMIGRDLGCMLRFNDPAVSRRHLRFIRREDELFVEDLGSSNGTQVNGRPVAGALRVHDGDLLLIGTRQLVVRIQLVVNEEAPTLRLRDLTNREDKRSNIHIRATDRLPVAPPAPQPRIVVDDRRPPPEPRRHDRGVVELRLLYISSELEIESASRDLSESGLFVVSEVLDPVGTECKLTIFADDTGPPVQLHGVVRRVVEEYGGAQPGLGIEFVNVAESERRWLKATVGRMLECELAASLRE